MRRASPVGPREPGLSVRIAEAAYPAVLSVSAPGVSAPSAVEKPRSTSALPIRKPFSSVSI